MYFNDDLVSHSVEGTSKKRVCNGHNHGHGTWVLKHILCPLSKMSLPNERTEPQLHYARLGDGFWFWIHDDEHSRWEDDDLHTPKWLPTNERTKRTTYEGFLGARTTRAGAGRWWSEWLVVDMFIVESQDSQLCTCWMALVIAPVSRKEIVPRYSSRSLLWQLGNI